MPQKLFLSSYTDITQAYVYPECYGYIENMLSQKQSTKICNSYWPDSQESLKEINTNFNVQIPHFSHRILLQ